MSAPAPRVHRTLSPESMRQSIVRLADLLALRHVPRWVIVPMDRRQSVAEHSFAVAMIALELIGRLDLSEEIPDELGFVLWALTHDAAESLTGDIPGVTKRRIRDMDDQNEEGALANDGRSLLFWHLIDPDPVTRAVVKLADLIETADWCKCHGVHSGHASRVIHKLLDGVQGAIYALVATVPTLDAQVVTVEVQDMLFDLAGERGREDDNARHARDGDDAVSDAIRAAIGRMRAVRLDPDAPAPTPDPGAPDGGAENLL